MPIAFSKESWFGFIASYLGAIGTILLGFISLYQNKKYKELSDSSEEKLMNLQAEIKVLTEKNVALIELNSKIEILLILKKKHSKFLTKKKILMKS